MNVANTTLDGWARELRQIRAWITKVSDRIHQANAPEDVQQMADQARRKAQDVLNEMIRAGAADPMEEDRKARQGDAYQPANAVPIEMLSSPKARRYAEAIRAAAVACRAMEAERYGPGYDGYGEHLEDAAEAAEFECYGPAGLGEG